MCGQGNRNAQIQRIGAKTAEVEISVGNCFAKQMLEHAYSIKLFFRKA